MWNSGKFVATELAFLWRSLLNNHLFLLIEIHLLGFVKDVGEEHGGGFILLQISTMIKFYIRLVIFGYELLRGFLNADICVRGLSFLEKEPLDNWMQPVLRGIPRNTFPDDLHVLNYSPWIDIDLQQERIAIDELGVSGKFAKKCY